MLALDTNVKGVVDYQPIGQMTRRQDSRKRLVEAALKLFASRGYHATGIADILRESGCKRGTLYYYFSSKEELGYVAIDAMMRLLVERGAGRHLRTNEHPIDRLLEMVDELPGVVKLDTGEALTPSTYIRLAALHDGFRQRLVAAQVPMVQKCEEMVRRGVADGQIADRVDPRVLTRVFVVMSQGIQLTSLLGQPEDIYEEARR